VNIEQVVEPVIYTEPCAHCLGDGTITGLCYQTMKRETKVCKKCNGAKVINYRVEPELRARKTREKRARRKKAVIPIRWVPPEKVPEEYNYDI
jgi:DnaJ-class molecular chaperone